MATRSSIQRRRRQREGLDRWLRSLRPEDGMSGVASGPTGRQYAAVASLGRAAEVIASGPAAMTSRPWRYAVEWEAVTHHRRRRSALDRWSLAHAPGPARIQSRKAAAHQRTRAPRKGQLAPVPIHDRAGDAARRRGAAAARGVERDGRDPHRRERSHARDFTSAAEVDVLPLERAPARRDRAREEGALRHERRRGRAASSAFR